MENSAAGLARRPGLIAPVQGEEQFSSHLELEGFSLLTSPDSWYRIRQPGDPVPLTTLAGREGNKT